MLKYFDTRVCLISVCVCLLDQFIKIYFFQFSKMPGSFYLNILIDKQMSEKVFCSNIAPS